MMRISSGTIFNSAVANMDQQQVVLAKTQQQVSTGLRMQTAADDPIAAAQALTVTQASATNTQYTSNGSSAQNTLSLASSALQNVTNLIQAIQSEAIQAGNGSYSNSDRSTIATQLSSQLQQLLGLANSTDGAGNYLFSGFQTSTQPFVNTAAGTGYFGDGGQRNVQVSATQQIATSDSGADVFMSIKNGNGTFATQAGTNTVTPGLNLGSGIISTGSVATPPPAMPMGSYGVAFSVTPGAAGMPDVTTYTVTNTASVPTTAPASIAAGANTATVASAAGLSVGNTIVIAGAGPAGPSTTAAAASAPVTTATLASVAGLMPGYSIAIGGNPAATITGIAGNTVTFTPATSANILANDPVTSAAPQTATITGIAGNVLTFTPATTTATAAGAAITPVISTGNPYVSGQNISFAGVQFNIQGAPANGDTFSITPSSNVSIFKTISDLITTLNTPVANSATGGGVTSSSLTNSLNYALANLGNALNNILTVQSSQGSRLNEIDSLQTTGNSLGLQYQQNLTQLQGVDMTQAISNLAQQQTNLQAAQKSFATTSSLSLFTYLP